MRWLPLGLAVAAGLAAAAFGYGKWRRHALATMPCDRIEELLRAGAGQEAAAALAARLAADPHDNRAWLLKGRAARAAGDAAGAEEALAKIEPRSAYCAEGQLQAGLLFLERNDAVRAKAALRRGLEGSAPTAEGWLAAADGLWTVLDRQGHDEALAPLLRALLPQFDGDRAHRAREALSKLGLFRRETVPQVAALRAYLAANPADDESRAALATALVEDGRAEEARALLEPNFAGAAKPPPPLWRIWCRTLFETRRFDELAAALDRPPADPQAQWWYWRFRAAASAARGDEAKARSEIERSLALAPRHLGLLHEAAKLAYRANDQAAGVKHEAAAKALAAVEEEARNAWEAMTNATGKPNAEAAARARRLAAALAALGRPDDAENYRRLAEQLAATP